MNLLNYLFIYFFIHICYQLYSRTELSQDVAAHIAEFLTSLGLRISSPEVSEDGVDSVVYQIENVISLLGKCADRSSFGNMDSALEKL